jgi:hypothetical protein
MQGDFSESSSGFCGGAIPRPPFDPDADTDPDRFSLSDRSLSANGRNSGASIPQK